jgi:hypothetical protein
MDASIRSSRELAYCSANSADRCQSTLVRSTGASWPLVTSRRKADWAAVPSRSRISHADSAIRHRGRELTAMLTHDARTFLVAVRAAVRGGQPDVSVGQQHGRCPAWSARAAASARSSRLSRPAHSASLESAAPMNASTGSGVTAAGRRSASRSAATRSGDLAPPGSLGFQHCGQAVRQAHRHSHDTRMRPARPPGEQRQAPGNDERPSAEKRSPAKAAEHSE